MSDPEGLPFMEGDQKPRVFKTSNSWAEIKSWQEVPEHCPSALQG